MKRACIISVVWIAVLLSGCSSGERWDGTVFPDRTKLLMHHSAGTFEGLAQCETACMKMLKTMDALELGYYECGKNCERGFAYDVKCEEKIMGNYYK